MPVLIVDAEHVLEYDNVPQHGQMLSLVRRSDGQARSIFGRGLSAGVRDALKTHTAERVMASYVRALAYQPWQPAYKPGYTPPID